MRRIFGDYVYSNAPKSQCYWDTTCDIPECPTLTGDLDVDVAIIGGGFTGLHAALTLAKAGKQVAVLDANTPGWGASGRNGGFCCLGGGKANDAALDRRFGKSARLEWRRAEKAAVDYVALFLRENNISADVHSEGETLLAHNARRFADLREDLAAIAENYGVDAVLHEPDALAGLGMNAGFYGGITIPIGFGLNPRKYLSGLLSVTLDCGAHVFSETPVSDLCKVRDGWKLSIRERRINARHVIVATNGYSSEDVPPWLASRYMPVQSSVAVTRALTASELDVQGWTSQQMCYDTRNLLHYFRLMPGNRILFGARGGLGGTRSSDMRARRRLLRHFREMFPALEHVEMTHTWSGMVCMTWSQMPFVGAFPHARDLWGALAYHGNGIAMGSYAGHMIAKRILGDVLPKTPQVMQTPLKTFPLGPLRRALMPCVYTAKYLADL